MLRTQICILSYPNHLYRVMWHNYLEKWITSSFSKIIISHGISLYQFQRIVNELLDFSSLWFLYDPVIHMGSLLILLLKTYDFYDIEKTYILKIKTPNHFFPFPSGKNFIIALLHMFTVYILLWKHRFLLKFTGKDEEINLLGDGTEKAEFGNWSWLSPEEIIDLVGLNLATLNLQQWKL